MKLPRYCWFIIFGLILLLVSYNELYRPEGGSRFYLKHIVTEKVQPLKYPWERPMRGKFLAGVESLHAGDRLDKVLRVLGKPLNKHSATPKQKYGHKDNGFILLYPLYMIGDNNSCNDEVMVCLTKQGIVQEIQVYNSSKSEECKKIIRSRLKVYHSAEGK